MFVGDSFTFGLGVESGQSSPELLPSLVVRDGRRLYAINAGGRGGYAGQQYEFLRQREDVLDPDMLVAQVYIGNDFLDASLGPYLTPQSAIRTRRAESAVGSATTASTRSTCCGIP